MVLGAFLVLNHLNRLVNRLLDLVRHYLDHLFTLFQFNRLNQNRLNRQSRQNRTEFNSIQAIKNQKCPLKRERMITPAEKLSFPKKCQTFKNNLSHLSLVLSKASPSPTCLGLIVKFILKIKLIWTWQNKIVFFGQFQQFSPYFYDFNNFFIFLQFLLILVD